MTLLSKLYTKKKLFTLNFVLVLLRQTIVFGKLNSFFPHIAPRLYHVLTAQETINILLNNTQRFQNLTYHICCCIRTTYSFTKCVKKKLMVSLI